MLRWRIQILTSSLFVLIIEGRNPMDKKILLLLNRSVQMDSGSAILYGGKEFEVMTFEDGDEAINMARDWQPDFILVDIITPKLDGYEVCRIIKGNPLTRHIHVVLVTGHDREIDKRLGQQVGAAGNLVRPVNAMRLIELINRILALPG